jgi:hypothetical protein
MPREEILAGQPDEIGRLVHRRGGVWAFDYDPSSNADDEKTDSSWISTSSSRENMFHSWNAMA